MEKVLQCRPRTPKIVTHKKLRISYVELLEKPETLDQKMIFCVNSG